MGESVAFVTNPTKKAREETRSLVIVHHVFKLQKQRRVHRLIARMIDGDGDGTNQSISGSNETRCHQVGIEMRCMNQTELSKPDVGIPPFRAAPSNVSLLARMQERRNRGDNESRTSPQKSS
jgi:hypothetical protein